ncbi:NAD(P)/FAD-dependent oxidoreductase [Clostridium sp.]|jgi:glycerol-3-phosphate dehydrogenase|uniref:NAD(P)/FAD-dependent oxidoreductase n=1 Tax=Clostridium sp. TaxID=1506 RepID=UPI002589C625|nr:NAD(P)/FAD-dependent oxidoreductase [Clostridium sp.]MDF2506101.1 putative dehydrogenase [Clostridium sp.]
MFDVIIIGAGVIGCSIAREISRYNMKICVLEKDIDVANGTSKANSGIVHAGYDAKFGSLKSLLNVRGNKMFDRLSEELDFPFKRNGSLVLCFNEEDLDKLRALKENGDKNKVPNLKILNKEEIKTIEPNVGNNAVAALYAPTGGIVCPYEMTIAYAENAYDNNVQFQLETEVKSIIKDNSKFIINTDKGEFTSRLIVNASGLFADEINNMLSENKFNIIPRKGEYCLFDKDARESLEKTLFQLPSNMGKGVLVTPTVDGNLLIGPSATDIEDKEDLSTSGQGLDDILSKAKLTIDKIPMRQIITSFSGLRAHSERNDFIIGEAEDVPNFINAAGIESPGLSSAPAIAEMVRDMVVEKLSPNKNENFNPIRKGIPKFREMTNEERSKLIAKDRAYGRIVCRCEIVTEGEIINSIKRPLGAKTLDGIKRRTRSGMGKCQGGFCSNKIVDILSRELDIPLEDVSKFGSNSNLLTGKIKE